MSLASCITNLFLRKGLFETARKCVVCVVLGLKFTYKMVTEQIILKIDSRWTGQKQRTVYKNKANISNQNLFSLLVSEEC